MMIGVHDRSKKTISVDTSLSLGTLRSRITASKSLRKYFRHPSFFSSYDADIVANSSILDIPVLSKWLGAGLDGQRRRCKLASGCRIVTSVVVYR